MPKIEINPDRISDGDEAWEEGWTRGVAFANSRIQSLEAENKIYWEKTKALCNNIKILGGKLQISELNAKLRGENLSAANKKIAELLKHNEKQNI